MAESKAAWPDMALCQRLEGTEEKKGLHHLLLKKTSKANRDERGAMVIRKTFRKCAKEGYKEAH